MSAGGPSPGGAGGGGAVRAPASGSSPPERPPGSPTAEEGVRIRKFRQAAFVYLHVGLLYEAAVWVLWVRGLLPPARGPGWVWLLIGAGILLLVFWGLWSWRNRWFARAVWLLHSARIPAMMQGAFFGAADAVVPPGLYLLGLLAVLVNLAFLARAGWDL